MANAPVPQLVKLREASARRAASQALTEQERLAAARRQHGLPALRLIYSSAEVREMRRAMRREFAAELRKTILHFMSPDPAFARMASLAVSNSRRGQGFQDRAARDWAATVAAARGMVDEEDARRAAAEAIVKAGRRRRAEED